MTVPLFVRMSDRLSKEALVLPDEVEDLVFGDSFLLNTKTWTWTKGPKSRWLKSSARNGGPSRVGHSAGKCSKY